MVELVLFYIFAATIIGNAVLMVTSRNIFHSALYLAVALFGVAAEFAMMGSFFIAGIQVLIYIGAIVVLTIFVINLTRQISGGPAPQTNEQVIPAILTALLAASLIILAVIKTDWLTRIAQSVAQAESTDNTALIGRQLLTDFVLPFEIISVMLLAALIGAIAIVSRDKEPAK
jgi:NADH-quinone oxidoreductase subunit J